MLHMVDHATRFSAESAVNSKKKEEVADVFIKHWIAIFGAPGTILSDNGGEFSNDLFHVLDEQFNINVKTTPGECPWPDAIVERHNAVLGKMVNKLLLDENNKYPIDVIVAWAVSAKNASHTCYGYSPNQLVFGKDANFPSNLTNKPPAMEDLTHSQLVVKHLNAMHAARKPFIEAESNEKLHRALKSKARVTAGLVYDLGDLVCYKRKDSDKWKGSGKVIGKENKQILVKHGGYYVCVHPCSLQLVSKEEGTILVKKEENVEKADSNKNQSEGKGSLDGKISDDDDSDSDFSPSKISHVTEDSIIDRNDDDIEDITSSLIDLSIQSPINLDITSLVQNSDEPDNPTVQHNILPTVKSKIIYHNPDSKSWNEVLVLGRAGKSNGESKTWFNLKDLTNNNHLSIDFSQIKGWKNTEEEVLIADSCDNIEILQAKQS